MTENTYVNHPKLFINELKAYRVSLIIDVFFQETTIYSSILSSIMRGKLP